VLPGGGRRGGGAAPVQRGPLVPEQQAWHDRADQTCGVFGECFPSLVIAAYQTRHGASGGPGLSPWLGARGRDGRNATAGAGVAQRQGERPDGPCDAVRGVGRGALGSLGPFLGPGGMRGLRAPPPLVAPTVGAGQVPTAGHDRVCGTVVVDGLVPTLCGVWGPRGFLRARMWPVHEDQVCSLFGHP
jgi:hypothetical protein